MFCHNVPCLPLPRGPHCGIPIQQVKDKFCDVHRNMKDVPRETMATHNTLMKAELISVFRFVTLFGISWHTWASKSLCLSFKAHECSLRKGKRTKLTHSKLFGFMFFSHSELVGQHRLHAVHVRQIAYCITERCRAVVTVRKNWSRTEESTNRSEQVFLLLVD